MEVQTSFAPGPYSLCRIGFWCKKSQREIILLCSHCTRTASVTSPVTLLMIKAIRRQGGQASVLDMASGREVIQRLEHGVVESHYLMDRVIKKAADSRGTDSSRLRLKIKHLADHSRLPEKSSVKPWSMPSQA
jgi:hypothetical protein